MAIDNQRYNNNYHKNVVCRPIFDCKDSLHIEDYMKGLAIKGLGVFDATLLSGPSVYHNDD